MTMFFFPVKLVTEMVTVPAAGSTAFDQAAHSTLLPVLQILLMTGFKVGVLHHDNLQNGKGQVIVSGPACGPDVVPNLQILQLDGRGIVQIRLARCKTDDLRCGLNSNFDVRARIRGQRDLVSVDGFDQRRCV